MVADFVSVFASFLGLFLGKLDFIMSINWFQYEEWSRILGLSDLEDSSSSSSSSSDLEVLDS